jgi:hypothetical protein
MQDIIELRDFFFDFEEKDLIEKLESLKNFMVFTSNFSADDSLSYGFWKLPNEGFPEFIDVIIMKMNIHLKVQLENTQLDYNHVQIVDTIGISQTNRLYPVEFTRELSGFSNQAAIIQIGCDGLLNHERVVHANSFILVPFKHFIYTPSFEESENVNDKKGYTLIFHKR